MNVWLVGALVGLLILLYGYLAAARVSFLNVSRSRLQDLAEEGHPRAARALHQEAHPHEWIPALLAARVALLLTACALTLVFVRELLSPHLPSGLYPGALMTAIGLAVLAPGALIFGEYVPRTWGARNPERMVLRASPVLDGLAFVLAPLTVPLYAVARLLQPTAAGRSGAQEPPSYLSEDEIRSLVEEGAEHGVFEASEAELIENVFEFADSNVRSIMIPRPRMIGIPVTTSSEEALRFMAENQFSRYPVYQESLNEVVGILYFKDFLGALGRGKSFVVRDLMRPPLFVPENMKVSHLLKEMQRRKLQMAVVVDEHGNVEGLATMEDVIEEIVGEISDETDVEEDRRLERLKDGSYLLDGSIPLRDLPEEMSEGMPDNEGYETLAGFLLDRLRLIPRGGEVVVHGRYKFTVVDMEARRIARVKAELISADETAPVESGKGA